MSVVRYLQIFGDSAGSPAAVGLAVVKAAKMAQTIRHRAREFFIGFALVSCHVSRATGDLLAKKAGS
jgi:hypothetical protein